MMFTKQYVSFSLLLCAAVLLGTLLLSRLGTAVAVMSAQQDTAQTVVIDPGHGGVDGGAVSVTGVHESGINLEISLRLRDLLELLGVRTAIVRETDISIHTLGTTISQKKVSDIRNRVEFVAHTPGALLVSIHQNQFQESKYRGAQVFYAKTTGSQPLAERLQSQLAAQLDPNNHRQCKKATDIYLMEHVQCPAVLVECGFLSNRTEEALLRDATYQKKLAAVIACTLHNHLEANHEV